MKFKATPEQMRKIAVLAVNASVPMGMGHLHYRPTTYTEKDISDTDEEIVRDGISIDYFYGRMTKLRISARGDGVYEVADRPPHPEYQSWVSKYPTYEALLKAAGVSA